MDSIFPLECPAEVFAQVYDFLASWHSGQSCPLYSLLSTGKVHSVGHLWGIQRELRLTANECDQSDEWQALSVWVATLPDTDDCE